MLCSVGNNREKRLRAKRPTRKNHSSASLACYAQTSTRRARRSEYICVDKDADYLRRDVDNPTVGIFRISPFARLICGSANLTNPFPPA
jgi:hypothetical protein